MKLYLIRHAIAEPPSVSQPDGERELTDEGREKMSRVAIGLRALEVRLDFILTSPLRRARETAAIVAGTLGNVETTVLPALAAGATPQQVLDALLPWLHRDAIALVGHEPDLGLLASWLVTNSSIGNPLPFKKGAIACFEGELVPGAHHLRLEWFLTPRQLRAIAGS